MLVVRILLNQSFIICEAIRQTVSYFFRLRRFIFPRRFNITFFHYLLPFPTTTAMVNGAMIKTTERNLKNQCAVLFGYV